MSTFEAMTRLRAFESTLRALGAESAFLFGSTSRGEAGAGSDVDVLIDLRQDASFTLLDLAAARRLLSEGLSGPVDVTTLADLSPIAGKRILAEALRIF